MQIILPLKAFSAAKQRLSGVLAASERAQLFQAMVEDVLHALTRQFDSKKIAICSRDNSVRWLANYYRVEFIDERHTQENNLNAAIDDVVKEFSRRGENDFLVVHGDLPLLRENDLAIFLRAHDNGKKSAVTIAPDRHNTGTNLLAWRNLPDFAVSYGANSFARHCAQARAFNIEPAICDLAGARCDIDEFDDLLLLLAQRTPNAAMRTLKYLRGSGIDKRLLAMRCGDDMGKARSQP